MATQPRAAAAGPSVPGASVLAQSEASVTESNWGVGGRVMTYIIINSKRGAMKFQKQTLNKPGSFVSGSQVSYKATRYQKGSPF